MVKITVGMHITLKRTLMDKYITSMICLPIAALIAWFSILIAK